MYTTLRRRTAARPILSTFSAQPRQPAPLPLPAALPVRSKSASTSRYFNSTCLARVEARAGSPPPPPPPLPRGWAGRRAPRWLRTILISTGVGVGIGWYDHAFLADSLRRTSRTFYFGVSTALDFKLFWDAADPDGQDQIHRRTAAKLHALLTRNGGLYIKLGQALAIQAAILPKPYREALNGLFDDAPQVPWDVADAVVRRELGRGMDDLFEEVEHEVLASASIAQVYKARMRHPRADEGEKWAEGEGWVAVKVRKPEIPMQIDWDLFAYTSLLWAFEKGFDIPITFMSATITAEMRKEADLHHEAENAEQTARRLAAEPALRGKVVVPRVEWGLTGKSVMTAEFVRAAQLTDTARLAKMGLGTKEVMDLCCDLYGAMTFKWGWVHCDPHPGNVLVRPNPSNPKHPQIVLIDHGLYITLSDTFKWQYCTLFTSALSADLRAIQDVAVAWGIPREQADLFASLALLRPGRGIKRRADDPTARREREGGLSRDEDRQRGRGMVKQKLQEMLANQEQIPRELIFLTRTLRMVQGNNAAVGSPSNRLTIFARWAKQGNTVPHSLATLGAKDWVVYHLRQGLFRTSLVTLDLTHFLYRGVAWVYHLLRPTKELPGLETSLQREVSELAKREFGVEIDEQAFAG